jgi:hypothetical protein
MLSYFYWLGNHFLNMLHISEWPCIMACDNTKSEVPYLLKCKTVFFLTFCALICEVILNSLMKHQTVLCQTELLGNRPCGVTPRPAVPNSHMTSPLFWDITQCWVVNSLAMFQENISVPSSKTRNPKERT